MNSVVLPGMPCRLPRLEEPPSAASLGAVLSEVDGPQSFALADVLRAFSPDRAYDFALDMHERACESGDLHRSDFWRSVVENLRASHELRSGRALQRSASPANARERPRARVPQAIREVEDRQVQS